MENHEPLLTREQAANYLGLDLRYLMRQCREGQGPVHLRPSPKRIFFQKADLGAWRESWVIKASKPFVPSMAGR